MAKHSVSRNESGPTSTWNTDRGQANKYAHVCRQELLVHGSCHIPYIPTCTCTTTTWVTCTHMCTHTTSPYHQKEPTNICMKLVHMVRASYTIHTTVELKSIHSHFASRKIAIKVPLFILFQYFRYHPTLPEVCYS